MNHGNQQHTRIETSRIYRQLSAKKVRHRHLHNRSRQAFAEQYPGIQTLALAMNDTEEGYAYPSQVRYEIQQDDRLNYERAASFLNQQAVGIINLQHEHGIYGGLAGSHVLTILRNVTAPDSLIPCHCRTKLSPLNQTEFVDQDEPL